MTRIKRIQRVAGGAAVALLLCARFSWSAGPAMVAQTTGSHRPAGRPNAKWSSLSDVDRLERGDHILYRVQIMNQGDQPARIPVALGPIPLGTAYVPGTATQTKNLEVEFSTDGGRTFSPAPAVSLAGKDGTFHTLSAPPEKYTTVRWRWSTPLPVGATAEVSYEVEVR
jgi:uncharacterized repeat protein (TIGR01451 family)